MPPASTSFSRCSRLASHDLPVANARYVDGARAQALARLGVHTIGQLIRHVPFRYLDLTRSGGIRALPVPCDATVLGRVHSVTEKKRGRLTITEVTLVDDTGVVIGVWFNQPWVKTRFSTGEIVAFAGRLEMDYGLKQIKNPFFEKLGERADSPTVGRVIAVHRTTEGLTTGWLRRLIASAVEDFGDVPDHLPATLRVRHGLVSLSRALSDIHSPETMAAAHEARRRLAFDELFCLQLYVAMRRHALTREQAGVAHRVDGPALTALAGVAEHSPTTDQRQAIDEILEDMAAPRPMNRMLLGDVGTGKTLVAIHALAAVADSAGQAAMIAPTEVLAQQYADKVGATLDALGVTWALLTGSTGAARRKQIFAGLVDGTITVLFGTHALLQESVSFKHLTLAIVDEQHRFGVGQRLGLRAKGAASDMLVMTATPIPRSLALTLYGDLAVSYLRQRPHAGAGISTHVTTRAGAGRAVSAVKAAVRRGHQAFVVCALVDESDSAQLRAASREAERLQREEFAGLRVGLLTGKMRPAEKAEAMQRFRDHQIDVLVSTTVIEVGVDVPNATVMIVEDADRFGLAQLHQLRGRVGRGEHPGEVWLVSDARGADARARLEVLEQSSDGFEIAERDLALRGEGSIMGDRQHGLPDLRIASIITDGELLEIARSEAFSLIESDPHLEHPTHGPVLASLKQTYAEAWEWVSAG